MVGRSVFGKKTGRVHKTVLIQSLTARHEVNGTHPITDLNMFPLYLNCYNVFYVIAISLMSNIQPMVDTVSMENETKIAAMECLLNHIEAGRQTCVRILTAFKIAAVSKTNY